MSRKKNRSTAAEFPVSPDNPFGIDLSPERIEPFVAREAPGVSRRQAELGLPLVLAWCDPARGIWVYHADCLTLLDRIARRYPNGIFDMIFADPPYFLSNGDITCRAGRMVSVNKGEWDRSKGPEENHSFNREWLKRCQQVLKPNVQSGFRAPPRHPLHRVRHVATVVQTSQ